MGISKHTICKVQVLNQIHRLVILIDFSFTVKAASLMFISGRGSAISPAKKEKSGSIYNLIKS